ncbi:hypothetical protein TIFTF001_032118 [Ficus carica]|uniref:Uncharacterized protein n=1 Tax=Ficus carica TaxID=3494 RepID=A0AA88J6A9_FICCA|nr:hypothetical protein TIFTF001_032118 [Ficus carica]
MRDMKAGFIATNTSLVEVDWSFVPEESEEIAAEEALEEVCLGSCSGTSNAGRCPVVGPNSVVREPQELSVKADVLGPARARPILVGALSWDLTPLFGNHRSCLQRQMSWVLLGHVQFWSVPGRET